MSPQSITAPLVRQPPRVLITDTVGDALTAILDSELPAVPVVDEAGTLAGVFGEREFMEALFPRYLGELKSAGFIRKSLDIALEKQAGCRAEPVGEHIYTEHVDVPADASDSHIAETFLHHRVLLLPVLEDGKVVGVITRRDFFRSLVDRVLQSG